MAYQKLRDVPANTMVVVAPALPGKQLLPFLMRTPTTALPATVSPANRSR